VITQRVARLCRSTLVTPSRNTVAKTVSTEGSNSPAVMSTRVDSPAAVNTPRALGASAASDMPRYPRGHRAHVREVLPRHRQTLRELLGRDGRIAIGEPQTRVGS